MANATDVAHFCGDFVGDLGLSGLDCTTRATPRRDYACDPCKAWSVGRQAHEACAWLVLGVRCLALGVSLPECCRREGRPYRPILLGGAPAALTGFLLWWPPVPGPAPSSSSYLQFCSSHELRL